MVTEIKLPGKQLVGILHFDSICELQFLEKLDFGLNLLYGTVTQDLKNCSNLNYLDLSNNLFSGSFPDFSNLERLGFLNLNMSGFSGTFPWKSLEKLTNLTFLSVGDNPFDRSPFPVEVLKLEKLYWLYLTNCSIEGTIPKEIGNLTKLENLELSMNYLSGGIPAEIGKLTNLWQLELYANELNGTLPTGFRNLTNLKNFDASTNYLEGDLSELKFLEKLESLQLFENNFSGEVPVEFGDFKFLVNLSLYTNKLTGPLPQKLGSWADFDFIDVSENSLTGPIPPDMCKNGKMEQLLMLQNKFTGGIPENYASCSSLTRFRVSNNSLTGVIPAEFWGLPKLDYLDLALNQFEGPVTSDIGRAQSLTQLHLENNRFSGQIPPEITKASSLGLIELSFNHFTGEIPSGIGELKKLNSLYLQENMISGRIPDSLGSCSMLNNINLAGNSISGKIPSSLGSLPSLNSLNLSRNKLSGAIPSSLSSLKLSLFDLSNNQLTGRIPQSLSIDAYKGSFAGNPELCSTDSNFLRPCSSDSGKSSQTRTIISCFLVGITILLISLALYIFMKRRFKDEDSSLKSNSWDVKSFHVLSFTEQEILNCIKQENVIGKGGSGSVYKVILDNGNIELAVKHIWKSDSGDRKSSRSSSAMLMKRFGNMPEFDAEVATLSSIRHVNVVKLYCSITSEDSSLLVYEYLPNGSLWDRLHTCRKMELDWETRYDIAVGAAKGLEYLHHGCDRPVIHRDVKSSNILLDEFFKPRIADFGLAKIVQASGGKDSTHVIAGTHGYIAPEYAYTYKVNEKSDVYSFGVVLMELVTGKRPIEPEFGDNKDIVYWISSKMTSRESVMDVVDSNIPGALKEDAVKVLRIAVLCTARLPTMRPSMRNVVQMLEDVEPCKLISIKVTKDNCSIKKESLEYEEKFKQNP
ncbi:Protein kinase domain [Macleaya cordata]|uniref:non-specific serine/threonine protein kinase n=1 Tax=Macleaya cordata TaxID=56857 RepID=A0A200Q165_MACCD|nr:Protein kinase domain [Macleaya cordata]